VALTAKPIDTCVFRDFLIQYTDTDRSNLHGFLKSENKELQEAHCTDFAGMRLATYRQCELWTRDEPHEVLPEI
jgi:hypothetical protein